MQRGKVLLVDDKVEFLTVLSERLKLRGYQVAAVGSGPEALRAVEQEPFDVIVLDLVMPVMDGVETLRRLRRLDPQSQIIVFSGYATSQEVDQALALGANDFLAKPADLDSLMERINRAIAKKAQAPQAT
ncbi:MAG: response regulator [Pseudomonadota bacterium]